MKIDLALNNPERLICPKTQTNNTKQSYGEVPIMLELWGMWSTPLLLLLSGPHWPRSGST